MSVSEVEAAMSREIDRLRARVAELEAGKLSGFFLPYAITDDEAKELSEPATFIAGVRTLRAENARLRAALEAAPVVAEPGTPQPGGNDPTLRQRYSEWFNTTRAEALK